MSWKRERKRRDYTTTFALCLALLLCLPMRMLLLRRLQWLFLLAFGKIVDPMLCLSLESSRSLIFLWLIFVLNAHLWPSAMTHTLIQLTKNSLEKLQKLRELGSVCWHLKNKLHIMQINQLSCCHFSCLLLMLWLIFLANHLAKWFSERFSRCISDL